ncbi:MAG: TIGR01459 family HAD-type hydrolase [Hyphomicrobiales bacterium]
MARTDESGRSAGLPAKAREYPVWLCDVWGVVHDGVTAFAGAVDALRQFRAGGGTVVLLTNAPRPAATVATQLAQLSVGPAVYDLIVTSGDVTQDLIASGPARRIFHLGPDRDLPFFDDLDVELVAPGRADAVVCTGLVEDDTETPEAYRDMLAGFAGAGLPLYCANPDIVVRRGDRLLPCAGALAELYERMGGQVVIAGKPHAPIYRRTLRLLGERRGGAVGEDELMVIGDGIATDIKGAADFGLEALFVTGGIHAGADERAGAIADAERMLGARLVGIVPELRW